MGLVLKVGVTLTVTPQIDRMLRVAQVAYAEIMGENFSVVVTSGNDGEHMKGSKHYEDQALDFRTAQQWTPPLMSETEVRELREELKSRLGAGYDVVAEADHLHVEWDPKTGGFS